MTDIFPPFTKDYRFTGPQVAVSCEVDWDKTQECYHAVSSNGFHGLGDTADRAAINCFNAWMGLNHGWYQPAVEPREIELWEIGFDEEVFGLFKTKEEAEKSLQEQIEGHGPAWEDCKIRRIVVK